MAARPGVLATREQIAYLRRLLVLARQRGLPRLPIWAFTWTEAGAWIRYLEEFLLLHAMVQGAVDVGSQEAGMSDLSSMVGHAHVMGTYAGDDGDEVAYCTICCVEF
jgi:hypothetical protein